MSLIVLDIYLSLGLIHKDIELIILIIMTHIGAKYIDTIFKKIKKVFDVGLWNIILDHNVTKETTAFSVCILFSA